LRQAFANGVSEANAPTDADNNVHTDSYSHVTTDT